jgi:hypothetical protein
MAESRRGGLMAVDQKANLKSIRETVELIKTAEVEKKANADLKLALVRRLIIEDKENSKLKRELLVLSNKEDLSYSDIDRLGIITDLLKLTPEDKKINELDIKITKLQNKLQKLVGHKYDFCPMYEKTLSEYASVRGYIDRPMIAATQKLKEAVNLRRYDDVLHMVREDGLYGPDVWMDDTQRCLLGFRGLGRANTKCLKNDIVLEANLFPDECINVSQMHADFDLLFDVMDSLGIRLLSFGLFWKLIVICHQTRIQEGKVNAVDLFKSKLLEEFNSEKCKIMFGEPETIPKCNEHCKTNYSFVQQKQNEVFRRRGDYGDKFTWNPVF